ncbi:MAG TPA: hypothetical protein VK936_11660 [Longimicrobiales bacterium]|nr:hypothetical protein [Longimicrobiales bacterium]
MHDATGRRARRPRLTALAAFTALLSLAACDVLPEGGTLPAAAEPVPARVDSILPIEEELHRFRAALPDTVTALAGGATSIDALVVGFLKALEARDASALGELVLMPAEFAWLYYPHTRFTARPYELSPAVVWFQLENYGSRGLNRALLRYGGRILDHAGHRCPVAAEVEGDNRIWSGCVIRHVGEAGDTADLSLFGGIIERDGRFKFINYANRL